VTVRAAAFVELARGRHALHEWLVAGAAGGALGLLALRAATSSSLLAGLLLAVAVAASVAVVVGSLRRLLLAVVVVDVAFQWDANVAYREDAAALGALGGFNVSATTIALAGLYALWLSELLLRPERTPRPAIRASLALAVFTAVTALSLVVARDRELAGFEVQLLVELLLLFVYVASVIRRPEELRFVVTMLVAALLVESLVIVAVSQTGSDLALPGVSTRLDPGAVATGEVARTGGTIGSPNAAGSFLSLLLAPALSLLAAPVGRRVKALAALAFALGALALVLTFSRGAWLAFLVSAAVLALLAVRNRLVPARVLVAAVLAVAVLAVPFAGLISSRLAEDESADARGPLMALAWRMVEDRPLLGVGANNFGLLIPDYAGPEFASEWLYAVHNKYLQVWSEAGTAALLAFVWFLAVSIRRGARVARGGDRLLAPLAAGLTAGFVGQAVNMSVETYHGRPQVELLWLVAGLLAAMHAMQAREER